MQMLDNEIAIRSRYLDSVIAGLEGRTAKKIGPTSITQNRIAPLALWRRAGRNQ
jgi:hypothetical protein